MRIGIMGGTFNPPHSGHINAATAAKRELPLDRVIFIPAGVPPHKEIAKESASSAERLEMTAIAARIAGAEVSDMEISREGKSFTIDTLRELRRKYPNDELWLIMGTDMFLSIESWREYENIFRIAAIAAVPRDKKDAERLVRHSKYLENKYGAISRVTESEAITISSSELREEIKNGNRSDFLPAEIYGYITEKKLYGQAGSDVI